MSVEEQKNIVAKLLGITPNEVTSATKINRDALQGSVKLHRLRSLLKAIGVNPSSWEDINTFGDLNGIKSDPEPTSNQVSVLSEIHQQVKLSSTQVSIGIDIESDKSIPDTPDYFDDQFFTDNFSGKEIAYCSRAVNPKACFAGRFAAKEAIFKATKGVCGKDFSKIEIEVSVDGYPINDLCSLSISHLNEYQLSIAVAVPLKMESVKLGKVTKPDTPDSYKIKSDKLPSYNLNNIFLWITLFFICIYILISEDLIRFSL